jgi:hypothetical protein
VNKHDSIKIDGLICEKASCGGGYKSVYGTFCFEKKKVEQNKFYIEIEV